jgi:hypothetical protein
MPPRRRVPRAASTTSGVFSSEEKTPDVLAAEFLVKACPKWVPECTYLDLAYEGRAENPPPAVKGLKVLRRGGLAFITWQEIEDPLGAKATTLDELKAALKQMEATRQVRYRIYRHSERIGSSRQGCGSDGVRVPSRQLPGSDGKHIRCVRRQRRTFCSDENATAALRQGRSGRSDRGGKQAWRPEPNGMPAAAKSFPL